MSNEGAPVAVPAGDRQRLEHLCRYVLRPPLAQERLERTTDGKLLLRLRRTWSDGTRAICFEPTELMEKLAAIIPKPRSNLLLYHGVFAPHARDRSGAVARAHEGAPCRGPSPQPRGEPETSPGDDVTSDSPPASRPSRPAPGADGDPSSSIEAARPPPTPGYRRRKHYAWADLLHRTFAIDVLACPDCGGRLRFLATIEHRAVIEKILRHLGLPTEIPRAAPPRVTSWLPGMDEFLGIDSPVD